MDFFIHICFRCILSLNLTLNVLNSLTKLRFLKLLQEQRKKSYQKIKCGINYRWIANDSTLVSSNKITKNMARKQNFDCKTYTDRQTLQLQIRIYIQKLSVMRIEFVLFWNLMHWGICFKYSLKNAYLCYCFIIGTFTFC